jgi:membrane associated rhomboid family serine protease
MSKSKYLVPIIYCILMISVFVLQQYNNNLTNDWSIVPRNLTYLKGIITMVFVHANLEHLSSNFLPFVICSFGLFYFYKDIAFKIITQAHVLTGILVWCFARPASHIGASGLIYALVFFTLAGALLKRNRRLIVFAFIVLTFQSGLIYGVMPQDNGISWEGHLFGAITGILLAIFYRKSLPEPERIKYSFEEEDSDDKDEYSNLPL